MVEVWTGLGIAILNCPVQERAEGDEVAAAGARGDVQFVEVLPVLGDHRPCHGREFDLALRGVHPLLKDADLLTVAVLCLFPDVTLESEVLLDGIAQ